MHSSQRQIFTKLYIYIHILTVRKWELSTNWLYILFFKLFMCHCWWFVLHQIQQQSSNTPMGSLLSPIDIYMEIVPFDILITNCRELPFLDVLGLPKSLSLSRNQHIDIHSSLPVVIIIYPKTAVLVVLDHAINN